MGYSKKFSYLTEGQHFDASTHVIVTFYMEAKDDFNRCAEAVAAESSVGTWTDTEGLDEALFMKYAARVFDIEKFDQKSGIIKVAYPLALFETDNIPQLLADVAGNVFGMRELANLRVRDVELPESFVRANKGPAFGIPGIRETLGIYDRPLLGTIIKPKVGLPTSEHVRIAYEAWVGGVDIVKDDENLSDQDFNPFYERVNQTLEARRKAERVTGQKKLYCPNISARISEMYARAKFVREMGGRAAMIDIVTTGYSGVQFMRDQQMNLILHGHRAMHGAFTHSDKHGIAMLVFAKLARLAGIDQLHTGTVVGKMEGTEEEVTKIDTFLRGDWFGMKPTMPIASGGLHPGHLPRLVEILGKDVIINLGGGIHGHPDGVSAGAKAARQALDAVLEGKTLSEYSQKHPELAGALKKWGEFGKQEGKESEKGTYVHALVKSPALSVAKRSKTDVLKL
ncbi:MAG: type III ribulose-bisphosphate carboxylase [Patescibacteria group bacterium]|nr:type III ribulose-bisphosphate carboxylase [Patescibacteria group bacterium]